MLFRSNFKITQLRKLRNNCSILKPKTHYSSKRTYINKSSQISKPNSAPHHPEHILVHTFPYPYGFVFCPWIHLNPITLTPLPPHTTKPILTPSQTLPDPSPQHIPHKHHIPIHPLHTSLSLFILQNIYITVHKITAVANHINYLRYKLFFLLYIQFIIRSILYSAPILYLKVSSRICMLKLQLLEFEMTNHGIFCISASVNQTMYINFFSLCRSVIYK